MTSFFRSRLDSNKDFVQAHKLLQRAKRVAFLGFGYNRDNLRRLLWGGLGPHIRECYGTAVDLTPLEQARITMDFKALQTGRGSNQSLDLKEMKVLDLLRHTGVLT